MNKYTSAELSNRLRDNDCELESELGYVLNISNSIARVEFICDNWKVLELKNLKGIKEYEELKFYAYDILNDICVKYVEKFFGDGGFSKIQEILWKLYWNKKQEAEDYIWEHCLFNPKNR